MPSGANRRANSDNSRHYEIIVPNLEILICHFASPKGSFCAKAGKQGYISDQGIRW